MDQPNAAIVNPPPSRVPLPAVQMPSERTLSPDRLAARGPIVFGRRMARLGAAWRREIDQELRPFGLTEATWRPMLMLGLLPPPVRQTDLARALEIEGGSLVRLLDLLERDGLIERLSDARDRRSNQLVVTEAGARLYDQVYRASEAVSLRLLAGVSEQERAVCNAVFDRIENAILGASAPSSDVR